MTWTVLWTLAAVVFATGIAASAGCFVSLLWRPDGELDDYIMKGGRLDRSRFTDWEWRLRKVAVHTRWVAFVLALAAAVTGW